MKKRILLVLMVLTVVEISVASNDYTFSCWLNGWRKNINDQSADLFGIETSRYGFVLNVDDFRKIRMGLLDNPVSYEDALRYKSEKLKKLPLGQFLVELVVDGVRYRAATCKAGQDKGVKHLSSAQLWESGRNVQHYDFLGLDFRDAEGRKLPCDARLDLVAWPGSLTFTLHVSPESEFENAEMRLSVNSPDGNWTNQLKTGVLWKKNETKSLTLTCDMTPQCNITPEKITVEGPNGQRFPVVFDASKNCYVASVNRLNRKWKTGYTDIRDYDDFKITVNSSGQEETIPFLLDLRPPANITGLCPILCEEKGRPTGIPVQISKNWHHKGMGSYLMAYTMLPAEKGKTYVLRIAYGFYGALPSASHAQLSLVGYGSDDYHGNNGRWDQLAIGCWGETICFDMDTSCVDNVITDVRMLMARNGLEGKKWSWTDAGWGGDWLNIKDENQEKYFQNHVKTAYLSQGPCLTDVRHEGCYGANQEVDFAARIQTLRTDDYARTFQTFSYTFTRDVSADKIGLFKLGRTHRYTTPELVYGNGDGLVKQLDVAGPLIKGQVFLTPTEISGQGPWWVALPGARHTTDKSKGTGYRALIIRDYRVISGGKTYTHPTISAPVFQSQPNNLDIELLPPTGITDFKKGDTIQLDLELITLHRTADDYYGPNEVYRKHLKENPNSWKTTYREAKGNNLNVVVTGGKVLNNYPVAIQADSSEVTVMIKGGVGAVPIRFEGLKSSDGYNLYQVVNGKRFKFDQSVHGNDFWQTDYDALTDSYEITYNISLDGINRSQWVLSNSK
ncbi:MAG: hypothetical protein OEV87_11410 [Phycisphaerae bacterium]|nr:hypothetical protein [Phycisphaerae bacterium]